MALSTIINKINLVIFDDIFNIILLNECNALVSLSFNLNYSAIKIN